MSKILACTEKAKLRVLRARYRAGRDLLDERELARLRLIRWLSQSGRLAP